MPTRNVKLHGADPVDLKIGDRVRCRRQFVGMSQSALGELLGVSFQQVQKYERGTNRVSASVLWRIAAALGVSITYFFEDLEQPAPSPAPGTGLPPRDEGLLLRGAAKMPSQARTALVEIAAAFIGEGDLASPARAAD